MSATRTVWVEVTNTLAVPYLTGFQRHTRELLARLPGEGDESPVCFIPVVWCAECDAFRRLDAGEADRLATFRAPAAPPASRLAALSDPLPDALKMALRRVIHTPRVQARRDELARRRRVRDHPASHAALRISTWPERSYLFDLEAAWHNAPTRDVLLPRLRAEGVTTTTLIADVMPEQFPQWFDAGQIKLFDRFVRAHLEYSDKFVCISRCSKRDVVEFAERVGVTRTLDTPLITMGANFTRAEEGLPRPAEAPAGRYLLSVATVEPRKNQALLIGAFERLRDSHDDLSLVLVGKTGWMTADLIERMRTHPDQGGRFRWLDKVDDRLLDALYRHAFLAVQPSFYEGFGTPVIEALGNGVPTLASTGGALPEAGGAYAEYFDPHDLDALVALVDLHMRDAAHHEARRAALVDYRPPSWEDGAAGILASFTPDDTASAGAGAQPGPRNT